MTTTTTAGFAPARPGRGTLIVLLGAAFVAGTFVLLAAVPYFSLNEARFGPYWARRIPLLLHVTGGMIAILSGPRQIWLGLTDQRPVLHRRLGYVYISGVLLGGAAALYLAATTTFGWMFGAPLAALAFAWFITTGLAVAAIKRSLIEQHKEWMIRSYVVTFGFVLFRVVQPLLGVMHIGPEPEAAVAAAWGCWTIPLLVAEATIQGRKIFAVATV